MMIEKMLRTESSWAPMVARIALAAVMLPHGAQKLLGWFGGPGFSGTLGWLTGAMGLPAPLAVLVILIESLGAVLLLVGGATRLAALGIAAVMLGAVAQVHAANGFFMNWTGAAGGEGFEYHLLALGLAACVAIAGGGKLSVDGWLVTRLQRRDSADELAATIPASRAAARS